MGKLAFTLLTALAFSSWAAGALFAQEDPEKHDSPLLDFIPKERALAKTSRGADQFGVYSGSRIWPTDVDTLRVCFLAGPQEIRTRIAYLANSWFRGRNRIQFDFGAPARLCDDRFSHIRVGFSDRGYWSRIGTDSLEGSQSESSLNLEDFDKEVAGKKTKPDEEFRRVVLHEFGHALGLEHEHQHPFSLCESEYNWDYIYKWLSGPPNNWPRDQIDFNMRALHEKDLKASDFDSKSIMLYSFPANFFKKGRASRCYSGYNTTISEKDHNLLVQMYLPAASGALPK